VRSRTRLDAGRCYRARRRLAAGRNDDIDDATRLLYEPLVEPAPVAVEAVVPGENPVLREYRGKSRENPAALRRVHGPLPAFDCA
jgi:hypothetical protein